MVAACKRNKFDVSYFSVLGLFQNIGLHWILWGSHIDFRILLETVDFSVDVLVDMVCIVVLFYRCQNNKMGKMFTKNDKDQMNWSEKPYTHDHLLNTKADFQILSLIPYDIITIICLTLTIFVQFRFRFNLA